MLRFSIWFCCWRSHGLFLVNLIIITLSLNGSCGRRTRRGSILPWWGLPLMFLNNDGTLFLRRLFLLINFSHNFWGLFSILGFHTMHIKGIFVSNWKIGLVLFVSSGNCLDGGLHDLWRQDPRLGRIFLRYVLVPRVRIRQKWAIVLLESILGISALLNVLKLLLDFVKTNSFIRRAARALRKPKIGNSLDLV